MVKYSSIEHKLADLESLTGMADHAALQRKLEAAIGDNHCRVAARGAKLAGEELVYELVPALLEAYRRFLESPLESDPNCMAKKEIARALVELDCDDAGFFLEGIGYRQMEPGWETATDSAVDVRCSCAMGLVATGYARALVELGGMLHDPEARVRAGAARAIACGSPRQAELLLRAKVLSGDAEAPVIGECFNGLLAVEPDASPEFVARYLTGRDTEISELAALALGESRLDDAFDELKAAWSRDLLGREVRRALISAMAIHRSSAAFDWLVNLAETADTAMAREVINILAAYRFNDKLSRALKQALEKRADPDLLATFARLWE